MKRISQFVHRLVYDNKLLLIVSLLVSVFVWLFVTIVLSPNITKTLKNVPIVIEMENSVPAQFSLEPFGDLNYKVDVKISGKRYVIGNLTGESKAVKVVAQTQFVDSVGKSRLLLKASKTNDNDEFTILSLSSSDIEVFFDVPEAKDFYVISDLDAPKGIAADGYMAGDVILSHRIISVRGPSSEVNSISRVKAQYTLEQPIDKTDTFTAKLVGLNEDNGVLHYLTFSNEVTMTVPIYTVVEKQTSVSFKNAPPVYHDNPLSYHVSPNKLKVGVLNNNANTLDVGTVNFTRLKPGENEFEFHINTLKDVKVISPKINTVGVTVSLDPREYTSVTRWVSNKDIVLTNQPDGFKDAVVLTGVDDVTVVGPVDSVMNISAEDIDVTVDLQNASANDRQTFDATVTLKNSDDCWIYGTYQVTIQKK